MNRPHCARLVVALLCLLPLSAGALAAPTTGADSLRATYVRLPLRFEPNRGQTDSQVKYLSRGLGYSFFLTPQEAVLSLTPEAKPGTVLRLKPLGASKSPRLTGQRLLPGKSHYLRGNDPSRWQRDIPGYEKVRYSQVYPGIDLVYYGSQNKLEYDWVVAPGSDPSRIRFAVTGARSLRLRKGDLVLQTPAGELIQHAPVIYQEVNGRRQRVEGSYRLEGRQVSFRVGRYDRTLPLVIDPVLSYSTYLGGDNFDRAYALAVDAAGNAYVTGETYSANYPRQGSFPSSKGGYDVFVSKLTASGSSLAYSLYFGGSGDDRGQGIAVDASGQAYVTGYTGSSNFPVTPGCLQATLGGGGRDVFLVKLNATGSSFAYATYLGGSGLDCGTSVALDGSGNAYLTGETTSLNFPLRSAFQSSLKGGYDAFISKVNATGSGLVYSSYYGGCYSDTGHDIAVDAAGQAYVCGATTSPDLPLLHPLQPTFAGVSDAWVLKLAGTGSLSYATYLGGSSMDAAYSLAVDGAGCAYVTGGTQSNNFPRANAYDSTYNTYGDVFLTKLNATGSGLVYSTYLGGTKAEEARGIALDASGNVYLAGKTASLDYPQVQGVQAGFGGGTCDAFVTAVSASGTSLLYSSYLGGSGTDIAWGIGVVALTGSAYVGGETNSTDLPVVNAYQRSLASGYAMPDGFVACLNAGAPSLADTTPPSVSLTAPTNGSTVSGTVSVTASATDNVGVASVSFYVDNVLKLTDSSAPYSYSWDTTGYTNANHTLKAEAKDAKGNTGTSSLVSVTVNNSTADTTAPSVSIASPANGATVSGTVTVQANASDNKGVASVSFYVDNALKSTDTSSPYVYSWNTTGYTNGSHALKAVAKDAAGNSTTSSVVTVTVSNNVGTAPSAPTGLTATPGDRQVALSWTASSGATSYRVKRSTTSGGPYTVIASPTGTSYTNTSLTNGTTYYYVVSAVNSYGESPNSAQVSARPQAPTSSGVPPVPTGLKATPGNGKVTLSWNESSGATSYILKRWSAPTGGYASWMVSGLRKPTYSNTKLENGTTYYYSVCAVNSAGTSADSPRVSATPG